MAASDQTERGPCGRVRWIEIEGSFVALEEAGSGPLVVLLHAPELGGSRDEWRPVAARLVDAGYATCLVDLPGFGESTIPLDRLTGEHLARFVLRLVTHHLPGPCHLAARGHAAAYAIRAAVAAPERVRSLVLLNGQGIHPTEVNEDAFASLSAPESLVFESLTSPEMIEDWLLTDVYFDPLQVVFDEVERIVRWTRRPGAQPVVASLLSGAAALDVRREWVEVAQPALLLWGEACDHPPLEDAERFLLPLRPDAAPMFIGGKPVGVQKPGVTYKSFPATRQRPHVEAAEPVAGVVAGWLGAESLSASRSHG